MCISSSSAPYNFFLSSTIYTELCIKIPFASATLLPLLQGDQKVSVHLMITVRIIRCTETFWSPCIYQLRWHNIPEDLDHRAHHCENLKPCNKWDNYEIWTSEWISFITHFSTIFQSYMMSHVKSKMPARNTRSKTQDVFMKHAWRRLHRCIYSLQGDQQHVAIMQQHQCSVRLLTWNSVCHTDTV